jgi:hypothetical protein
LSEERKGNNEGKKSHSSPPTFYLSFIFQQCTKTGELCAGQAEKGRVGRRRELESEKKKKRGSKAMKELKKTAKSELENQTTFSSFFFICFSLYDSFLIALGRFISAQRGEGTNHEQKLEGETKTRNKQTKTEPKNRETRKKWTGTREGKKKRARASQ